MVTQKGATLKRRKSAKRRLLIIATHPVQYQAFWYASLAKVASLEVEVFYGMIPDAAQQGTGFGVSFHWDVPLLDDYSWRVVTNRALQPSLSAFAGCNTPEIALDIWRAKPDVVLITGWHSLLLVQALVACRLLRVPTLVRGDSNVLAPRSGARHFLQTRLLRQYSGFLAVGELNQRLYERANIEPDRIFFCPHFVDNTRYMDAASSTPSIDQKMRFGLSGGSTCFLFAGKLIEKKRPMDFVKAVEIAAKRVPTIVGMIVGAGEQFERIRDYVIRHRVPVKLVGFLNQLEMTSAYSAADCLVLPSDYAETWGLVVNEAMASGRPAIVSDQVGCRPDLVVDGSTGWSFPFGSVEALAARLVDAADRELLRRMGQEAMRRVATRYSAGVAVDGVLRAVARLCE